jgi:hypothetical protein
MSGRRQIRLRTSTGPHQTSLVSPSYVDQYDAVLVAIDPRCSRTKLRQHVDFTSLESVV